MADAEKTHPLAFMQFKRYGFLYVVTFMWLVSMIGFWIEDRADDKQEHQATCEVFRAAHDDFECPKWTYSDSSFWNGFWENIQSENYQMLLNGLLIIAMVNFFAQKDSENTKNDIREVLRERFGDKPE